MWTYSKQVFWGDLQERVLKPEKRDVPSDSADKRPGFGDYPFWEAHRNAGETWLETCGPSGFLLSWPV